MLQATAALRHVRMAGSIGIAASHLVFAKSLSDYVEAAAASSSAAATAAAGVSCS